MACEQRLPTRFYCSITPYQQMDMNITRGEKGQSTVEMLVAVAIATIILAYLVNFTTTQVLQLQERQAAITGQTALAELTDAINTVNTQPIGTQKRITLSFPRGIDASNTRISGKSLVLRVYGSDITATTNAPISGSLPTTFGIKQLLLTRTANGVTIGTNSISSSAASIYLPMARDTNQTTQITLTNMDSSDATLSISLSWNHTLVQATTDTASGTLSGNSTFDIDLDAAATASAIGNYTGLLQISATFSDRVESFSIPVNIEVFSNTGALMSVVPSSLYFTTLGPDTNSAEIQICNTSNTALKSISFIPSSGNAGDWVQSISSISSLSPQSCTTKTVEIVVPPTASYGNYSGSLAITDFSGANTHVLPITLNVFGESNAFEWDWNGTTTNTSTVYGFSLRNNSSGTLTITNMTISKWWNCDSNHSTLEAIRVETGTVLNNANADDGDYLDITDFDIDPNDVLDTSNSLTFNGTTNDEGEQFQAFVTFSDDSNYTSSTYGTGCSLDTTPPGTVADLSAATGPSFRSIQLSFTAPGDDNFSGYATDVNLRYAMSSIDDENEFAAAREVTDVNLGKLLGGSTGRIVIRDLNIGTDYYYALKFRDESGNWSSRSNTSGSKPRTIGSISSDPTSFYFFPAGTDVDQFFLSNAQPSIVQTRSGRFFFHIDSLTHTQSYTVDVNMNFDTNKVNRIRVWYPKLYVAGIDSTAANYDANPNQTIDTIDLLSSRYIGNIDYRLPSLDPPSSLLTSNLSRFEIVATTGLSDINYRLDANT